MNENSTFLDIPPANPSGWAVAWKTVIWFTMWILISFLIFIIITMLGKELFVWWASLFVPIILSLIAFLWTFIGNSGVWGSYNLFFSYKYYDFGKMFALILLANWILLMLITPVYFLFGTQWNAPFLILAMHVFFSVYVTQTLIETFTNPNYAWSAMIWSLIAFSMGMISYLIVYWLVSTGQDATFYLMLTPSILAFTITPLVFSLREKVYFKFYEFGSNFLYLPSMQEVTMKADELSNNTEDEEWINIEM